MVEPESVWLTFFQAQQPTQKVWVYFLNFHFFAHPSFSYHDLKSFGNSKTWKCDDGKWMGKKSCKKTRWKDKKVLNAFLPFIKSLYNSEARRERGILTGKVWVWWWKRLEFCMFPKNLRKEVNFLDRSFDCSKFAKNIVDWSRRWEGERWCEGCIERVKLQNKEGSSAKNVTMTKNFSGKNKIVRKFDHQVSGRRDRAAARWVTRRGSGASLCPAVLRAAEKER